LARADDDAIEAPWGTVHADLGGTASTTGFTYSLGEGPLEEKWRLDIVAEGHDRPAGRSSIVFDKDGNLYWITTNGGGTAGVIRIVSVAPDGHIRWFGNDGAGNVHALGSTFGGASPSWAGPASMRRATTPERCRSLLSTKGQARTSGRPSCPPAW
jgi:hypothetical protein